MNRRVALPDGTGVIVGVGDGGTVVAVAVGGGADVVEVAAGVGALSLPPHAARAAATNAQAHIVPARIRIARY